MPVELQWVIFLGVLSVFWWIRLRLMAHFWRKAHTTHQIALLFSVTISLTALVLFLLGLIVFQGPTYMAEHLDFVGLGFVIALLLLLTGYPLSYFLSHSIVFTREYSRRFQTSGAPLQQSGVNRDVSDFQD